MSLLTLGLTVKVAVSWYDRSDDDVGVLQLIRQFVLPLYIQWGIVFF